MAWMGAVLGALGKGAAGAAKGVAKTAMKAKNSKAGKSFMQHEKDNFKGKQKEDGKQQQVTDHKSSFAADWAGIPKAKKGGFVKKTGIALLHRGEVVVPARRASHKGRRKSARSKSVVKA